MNLQKLLSRAAKYYGERCAFECGGKERTFLEIDANSNKLANALSQLGVSKGDKVAIFSDNCVEYIESAFAMYKSGIIEVAINPMLSPGEVQYIIDDSEANTVIVNPGRSSLIKSIRSELKHVKNCILISEDHDEDMISYHEFIQDKPSHLPPVDIDDTDLLMFFYTGGTTGVPKGAMHTHEGIIAVLMNLQSEYWQLTPSDVLLAGGSLAHANAFRAILSYLEGAKMVIPSGFVPTEVFEMVEKDKVTVLSTVPATLIRFYNDPDLSKYDLSSLRLITYGAAPMPSDKLKEAIQVLGPRFGQSYGQAESLMAISTLHIEDHVIDGPEKLTRRLASAGRPYSWNEVKVVDDAGAEVKPGEIGEIICKSKINMTGYWNNPDATDEALKDGWVYTGDLGTFDEDGFLFIVDRKKDMIITGGYNVYAREVEDVIHGIPAVVEAAVIGVPDNEWGESIKAIVVLKPGMNVTKDEIIQRFKANIAGFKKPKSIDFVDELPKTSVGKIDKKKLKATYIKK